MTIIQITAGAGKMYCGACFRDNALVTALRKLGHSVIMVPLYLPASFEQEDQSAGTPIFFSGIRVYLEQKFPLFKNAPRWLHRFLASPWLLKLVSGAAVNTRPEGLGEMTLSMLKGEEGNQARELEELIAWLKKEKPGLICLSNALLVGLARRLKAELNVPVVCSLQGEDYFLDSLPSPHCEEAWKILAQRAAELNLFIAPSQYYGDLMRRRLNLPPERVRVIHNGINLEGFEPAPTPDPQAQTIGFFARMCPEKGLDTLVQAFLLLKSRSRVNNVRLRIGGYCAPADETFVNKLKARLKAGGVLQDVEFHPNLSRSEKQEFLRSLTIFSTPATYGEAFGLYVIEAIASGVPVVQPDDASFPELIQATGAGLLCAPRDASALANALEQLLLNPGLARSMGEKGRKAVFENFGVEKMAQRIAEAYQEVIDHCNR